METILWLIISTKLCFFPTLTDIDGLHLDSVSILILVNILRIKYWISTVFFITWQ